MSTADHRQFTIPLATPREARHVELQKANVQRLGLHFKLRATGPHNPISCLFPCFLMAAELRS